MTLPAMCEIVLLAEKIQRTRCKSLLIHGSVRQGQKKGQTHQSRTIYYGKQCYPQALFGTYASAGRAKALVMLGGGAKSKPDLLAVVDVAAFE